MALTGGQYERFVDALVAAFDQFTLAQMLQFRRGTEAGDDRDGADPGSDRVRPGGAG